MTEQAREARLRRLAARHDLVLRKSRRRDPNALDYGKFGLLSRRNVVVFGLESWGWDATLDEIDGFLRQKEG